MQWALPSSGALHAVCCVLHALFCLLCSVLIRALHALYTSVSREAPLWAVVDRRFSDMDWLPWVIAPQAVPATRGFPTRSRPSCAPHSLPCPHTNPPTSHTTLNNPSPIYPASPSVLTPLVPSTCPFPFLCCFNPRPVAGLRIPHTLRSRSSLTQQARLGGGPDRHRAPVRGVVARQLPVAAPRRQPTRAAPPHPLAVRGGHRSW